MKEGEGNAGATKTAETEQKSIGKLLGDKTNGGIEQQASAASASIGAVSGADILKAIASSLRRLLVNLLFRQQKMQRKLQQRSKKITKDFGIDSAKQDVASTTVLIFA